jgi:RNA polymerase sigma-70 factor, ECF subfamily
MTAVSGGREDAVARDDRQLIERISCGDGEAFGDLYDRYCARAYRIARRVCHDDGRTEDAVQEAFLSIWHTCDSYRPAVGTVATWLLAVVRNRAVDLSRRNARHTAHRADPDLLDSRRAAGDVAAEAVTNADASRLHALLAQLPDAQQEVIVLAFYGQLTHTEIADHLELPPGTVKGRMRLGLQKLRADIDQAVA